LDPDVVNGNYVPDKVNEVYMADCEVICAFPEEPEV